VSRERAGSGVRRGLRAFFVTPSRGECAVLQRECAVEASVSVRLGWIGEEDVEMKEKW
jgi:hypothetical protein